jgi:isopenicillin N synthase-like dioxygenase
MLVVPRISLAGDETDVARRIDEAASTIGFFQISEHGIDPVVIETMRAATARFFALPLIEKTQSRPPTPEINRGYAAKGTEGLSYSLALASPPDLFEAFNVGPEDVAADAPWAATPFFAANLWPDESVWYLVDGRRALPTAGFRDAVLAYYRAAERVAHRLTDLFAVALRLEPGYFAAFTDHSTDTLRINHYQRGATESDPRPGQFGMGEHTDYGIVTVLYADPVPGLQILYGGEWHDVVPDPDCLLVNLGDLTANWTNDRWRSTLHRVLPPEAGTVRRSVAFFHDGNYDARIECLPTCTSPDNPPRYPPVTAGEHLMAKLLGPRTLQASTASFDTTTDRR